MQEEEQFGTNADGSRNRDYCVFCYKDGAFTQDVDLEGMIEINVGFIDEYNKAAPQKLTKEEYRKQLEEWLPTLKRWA